MKEMVGGCCVCSDERGWPDNPLVYCDGNGCTVAVHQACYGIVTVPTGPWFCRKCESPETVKSKVRCELCPSRSGALKKADTGGWAHVVCALYIPEVRFGDVTSMEPIVLRLIPPERFTRTCYICTENGKAHRASQGACMACNKSGCKQQFHVTCAQSLGLLCEEAGNYLDNVKYCGYCQHHYSKLFTNHEVTVVAKKKGGNVKTIPPYKPVTLDSHSSGSSSEKEGGASPMASGSGTTPHTKGSKGPGRKSSQNRDSSKNSHASKAAPATTSQPMDKKKSPSRRQSSTGDGVSTSKTSTPAPSPSHSTDMGHSNKGSGSASERGRESSASRSTPPSASPNASKSPPTGGVISSVASVTATSSATVSTSTSVTTSVVQTTAKLSVTFQESVITNTDAIETKHTKKRKAAAAAATAAAEQAAQANANESPGRQTTNGVEVETKHNKKRKAVAAASADAEKEQASASDSSVPASVELELKHNKKRKAVVAATAAATAAADAEREKQNKTGESPARSEGETKPVRMTRKTAANASMGNTSAAKPTAVNVAAAKVAAAVNTTATVNASIAVNAAATTITAVPIDGPIPEKKTQSSSNESPSDVAVKSPSHSPKAEASEDTKQTKKRKAAAAAAATDKEPLVVNNEEDIQLKESATVMSSGAEIQEETKFPKKRKAASGSATPVAETAAQAVPSITDLMLPQKESPKRVSPRSPKSPNLAKSPSVPTVNENLEEKITKKRKAVVAAAAFAIKESEPLANTLNEQQVSPKESPSSVSNADSETKYTKKRKAVAAASAAASAAVSAAAAAAAEAKQKAAQFIAAQNEAQLGSSGSPWDLGISNNDAPVPMDTSDKNVKKAKTDSNTPPPAHYLSPPPPPPLPPMRSPRRLTSPMPGPSSMNPPAPMNPPNSMNPPSAIRSPSQHQGSRAERERHASLLVSVPLPPAGRGRHFATHSQVSTEMPAPPSPHVFHHPQKPATMDSGIPSHSPHAHSQRSNWGGLNVAYEMHPDPSKPGVSGMARTSKDHSGIPMPPLPMPPMPPALRNKKRAAMAVSMANSPLAPPQSTILMASTSSQIIASARRYPPLPPPQSIYQETVKESPPVSPNTERQMKAKAEHHRILATAPHMLGNELNPESGAAARLQEQLNAELAAHAVAGAGPDPIVPPPLMNKAAPGTGARATGAQSLDQLLERQWEQGSQFLMEQAQHFDIASLLSCLHQLRTENVRLEEHVSNLLQRRDHLLAVNARLAIPLNSGGVADSSYQLTFQGGGPSQETVRGREAPPRAPPARAADPAAERERHADRAQVAQQLSHQMLMREVQQKPS